MKHTALKYETSLNFAKKQDQLDPLKKFRKEFLFPKNKKGKPYLYFTGNSLGLQPTKAKSYVGEVFEDWKNYGVEGHTQARRPWFSYHELLTDQTAKIVGAKPKEIIVMNTLSVNLHLMMVSFYRPTKQRYKILIEKNAFPSDQYAVASQARFHAQTLGFNPKDAILEADGNAILETIEKNGSDIALVLIGNVNYLSGQAFDIAAITKAGHTKGCFVGFDLAHGVGNLILKLNEWGPDFATWCSYKYLNGGPGALSGCFIHERHLNDPEIPRFEGWWGTSKEKRFLFEPHFNPIPTAEAWQLSNPPIFQLAALRASMELFQKTNMLALRKKSEALTGYLEYLLSNIPVTINTPRDPNKRGAQLSLKVSGDSKRIVQTLNKEGVIADHREPNIIRVAPAPLYNCFQDVYHLVEKLDRIIK